MKLVFLLGSVLVLGACASEKKPLEAKGQTNQPSKNTCPSDYNPIPLLRDGISIEDPNQLPAGNYNYAGSDLHVRGPNFQAHYVETFRDSGVSVRPVCVTAPDVDDILELKFTSVVGFQRSAADVRTYQPAMHMLLGEGGKFRFSRAVVQGVQTGGLAPFLAQWRRWRIYQTAPTLFEIRLSTDDREGGVATTKNFVLRFYYQPL